MNSEEPKSGPSLTVGLIEGAARRREHIADLLQGGINEDVRPTEEDPIVLTPEVLRSARSERPSTTSQYRALEQTYIAALKQRDDRTQAIRREAMREAFDQVLSFARGLERQSESTAQRAERAFDAGDDSAGTDATLALGRRDGARQVAAFAQMRRERLEG